MIDALEPRTLFASVANKVADINQGSLMLDPEQYAPLGTSGITLFTASSYHGDGAELWRTDGTAAGTKRVKDIRPGIESSIPSQLVNVNGTVFFTADDGSTGTELWKSDGTEAGTMLVKDITPSAGSAFGTLTSAGDKLYLFASNGLWSSDGTAANTARIGTATYTFSTVKPMVAVGSTLYFGATSAGVSALFRTDGVTVTQLKTFEFNNPPRELATFNGKVYFNANQDSSNRGDLWVSDGTAAGTTMVKSIGTALYSSVTKLTVSGSYLYFSSYEASSGVSQLYRTDGTSAGTITLGSTTLIDRYATFTPIGTSSILFSGRTAATGAELYRSDGVGTPTLVKEVLSGTADGATGAPLRVGSNYYFSASRTDGYTDIWKTDGTAAGTVKVFDTGGTILWSFGAGANVTLFFSLTISAGLGELWKSDGTTAGTVRVGTSNAIGNGSSMSDYWSATVNSTQAFTKWTTSKVIYAADDGIHGSELWVTDSQTGVTQLLADINPGVGPSDPNGFTLASDGSMLFQARRGDVGREIFRLLANGTVELVADVYPGLGDSYPQQFVAYGTSVYYTARSGADGYKFLYRYDVATQTNSVVRDASGAALLSSASLMLNGSTALVSAAPESTNPSFGLYSISAAGATPVRFKTLNVGWNLARPWYAVLGTGSAAKFYFSASDGTNGYELWTSDGTAAGTTIVKDIFPGSGSGEADEIIAFNNKVYFTATTDDNTYTLWSSDGTSAGTAQYASNVTDPTSFSKVGSDLYFVGTANGVANVYRTDGSGASTTTGALRPILTNTSANFRPQTTYGGAGWMLFYVVEDRTSGGRQFKLYSYLPNSGTTTFVKDLWNYNSFDVTMSSTWYLGRLAFLATNNRLFFPAYRPEWGVEPHSYVLDPIATQITGNVYYDKNKNGAFNSGIDTPASGVTVFVDFDNDGTLDSDEPTAVTNASGNYSITNLDTGSYIIRTTSAAGLTSTPTSVTATIGNPGVSPPAMGLVVTTPPTIANMTFDRNASRMRVKVVFSTEIDPATLAGGDLQLTLRPSGSAVANNGRFVSYLVGSRTAYFTFDDFPSGILPSGHYRATIAVGAVADLFGNVLASAAQTDFDFQRGDITGDGIVNFDDLIVLAQNYNKTGMTFSQGNLNYDNAGTVNFDDLIVLAQAYNTSLPPAVAATSAAKKPSSRTAAISQIAV